MKRFFNLLGNLLLALLNATLLLALALAVVVFLVLGKIQDLGTGAQNIVRDTLTPQITQLENVKSRLEQIEAGITTCASDSQLREQIDGIQTQLTTLNQGIRTITSARPKNIAKEFFSELMKLVQEKLKMPAKGVSG